MPVRAAERVGLKRVDACDVVVIGGGLVGAWVAARCAREGRHTAVLEALEVAGGATGRSTGLVLAGLALPYARTVARYGRELAREIWNMTLEGRQQIVAAAEALAVPLQRTGSLAVASEPDEADVLSESARLLQEDGFDVWFGHSDPLQRGFHAALRSPHDITLNAAELTQALLESTRASNPIVVHEGTEVFGLQAEGRGVRVWARGRTVLCEMCFIAVDGCAPLLDRYFADKVALARGLTLATEPLGYRALERPCTACNGQVYCRQLPDRRLLLGAWRRPEQAEGESTDDDALMALLARFAARHFPEVRTHSVERWSGVSGFTLDDLPLVGQLPDLPAVHFALGLGGRGLAMAAVAAERMADFALMGSDPGLLSAARVG